MIRHRRHWALHLLMLCALAAVITRALIPTGYMAVADGDRISVTLCGSGQAAIIDLDGDQPTPALGNDAACAFAVAAVSAPPPAAPAMVGPAFPPVAATFALLTGVRVGHGLAAPPPPARGPPLLI